MSRFKSAPVTRLLAASLLVAAAALAQPSYAGTITFTAPTINLTQSNSVQTGFFDVVVTETGGSDLLNEFQADLLLPNQSNVTFIGADLNTSVGAVNAAPYVYAGNTSGPTPFLSSGEAANSDVPNTNNVSLSGTPLAMIRIEYSVAAGFAGTVALTLNQDDPNTDPNADNVQLNSDLTDIFQPGATINGAIVVAPIPEPATWLLAVLGAVGLFGARRLRGRRA
jgi:hypothetical protein